MRKEDDDMPAGEQPSVSSKKPERKRRRRRDKEKPKRSVSAYLVFLNRHRQKVQDAHPTWSVTEVTKHLATKWKDVSASERAECQKISDADKERYYEEMRNYVPLPDEKEEEPAPRYDKDGNRKRRKKDKNAPRKNRSAYIIWAQEYREKHFRPKASTPQAVSLRDQATQLGNAWKKMTDKDKKKYVDAAMREAQEYAIKRDAFIAEKKALAIAAREAKRQRLLDEKRAWEATKLAAAALKKQRKEEKAAEKAEGGKPKQRKEGSLAASKTLPKSKKQSDSAIMEKMRQAVLSVAPSENAWMAIMDTHEQNPETVMNAYKNFLDNKKQGHFRQDPKAFLVACLGYEEANGFLS